MRLLRSLALDILSPPAPRAVISAPHSREHLPGRLILSLVVSEAQVAGAADRSQGWKPNMAGEMRSGEREVGAKQRSPGAQASCRAGHSLQCSIKSLQPAVPKRQTSSLLLHTASWVTLATSFVPQKA